MSIPRAVCSEISAKEMFQTYRSQGRFVCYAVSPSKRTPTQVRFSPKVRTSMVKLSCCVRLPLHVAPESFAFASKGSLLDDSSSLKRKRGADGIIPFDVYSSPSSLYSASSQISGEAFSVAYAHEKETVADLKRALVEDVKRSIASRVQIAEDEAGPLPSRVTFSSGGMTFSDYFFMDDDFDAQESDLRREAKELGIDIEGALEKRERGSERKIAATVSAIDAQGTSATKRSASKEESPSPSASSSSSLLKAIPLLLLVILYYYFF